MNILVVDDIGYSRRSLQMVLARAGHKVVEADGSAAALAALTTDHTIKTVITDLLMPGMDGVELFAKAKRLERFNDDGRVDMPEFILLTSAQEGRQGTNRGTEARLRLAREIGFKEVLSKPLDQASLLKTLETMGTTETDHSVDVSRTIEQIQDITKAVIETQNEEQAACLLECLEEQSRALRKFQESKADTEDATEDVSQEAEPSASL